VEPQSHGRSFRYRYAKNTTATIFTEIVGYYRLSKDTGRAPQGAILSEHSGFRLGADHKLEIFELPAFDLIIDLSSPAWPGGRPSCAPAALGLFEFLGHSRPYRIWYYIGDPDSEQGLTYVLQGP